MRYKPSLSHSQCVQSQTRKSMKQLIGIWQKRGGWKSVQKKKKDF